MTLRKLILTAAAGGAALFAAAPAQAQEYYVGQVILVANSFCPRGSTEASGTLLPIQQYSALFSLYGTTFGGNGTTNFALPDLRGRAANGRGQGPGLSDYSMGEVGGTESVSLTILSMPVHTHGAAMQGVAGAPNTDNPVNGAFADFPNAIKVYNKTTPPNVDMAPDTVQTGLTGSGMPVPTRGPYLVLRYCVMLQGIFPSRP